jgi:hypothetical protein
MAIALLFSQSLTRRIPAPAYLRLVFSFSTGAFEDKTKAGSTQLLTAVGRQEAGI